MKKIAKVVLAVATVALLASCGGGKKQSKAALEAAANGDYSQLKVFNDPKTGKPYDFGGITVTVWDWWSNPNAEPTTKQQVDTAAYRQYLMDTYNFKYVECDLGAGWGGYPEKVLNICATGDRSVGYSVFRLDGRPALKGLMNGYYADLSKTPDIDWKDPKWNQAVKGVMQKGKSFYCFNAGAPEPKNCLFFNKRILEENGYDRDLPYDLQKEGKWTWAKFEEILAKLTKDTNADGIIDQYGMASFNTEFSWQAIASNGADVVVGKDKDGKFVLDMSDAEKEAWQWIQDMFMKYNKPQGDANWDYWRAAFVNGEVGFMANQEYDAQPNGNFKDMKDDFGMVSFPSGPKGNGKPFTFSQDYMWVIPSFYEQEEVDKIMKIMDFITDPTPGYDDPDAWKESYYAGFRDERAVDETLQYFHDNALPFYAWLVPDFNYAPLAWSICAGADVSSTLEENQNQLQAALDKVNK